MRKLFVFSLQSFIATSYLRCDFAMRMEPILSYTTSVIISKTIEFSIINTNIWLKTEIQVPFVGIDESFTAGSEVLLQKYRKNRGNTQYWDYNIEHIARMPMRLVEIFLLKNNDCTSFVSSESRSLSLCSRGARCVRAANSTPSITRPRSTNCRQTSRCAHGSKTTSKNVLNSQNRHRFPFAFLFCFLFLFAFANCLLLHSWK